MTTPHGAEGDLTGLSFGRRDYQPEDMVLAGIDAVTGGDDHPLNEVGPPPGGVMPEIVIVDVPDAQPGEEIVQGSVKPLSEEDAWPEEEIEDKIARILREMGEGPDSSFPTLQVKRGASGFTIAAANAEPETRPQDNPMDPGGAV